LKNIITFSSKKGGVSKTTSAIITALMLSEKHKTLLIDLDSQNALTDFFFEDYQDITIYEALKGDVPFKQSIKQVSDNLFVIPNKVNFEEIDNWTLTGKEFLLKDELLLIEDDFEYVVIDTPPSLKTETVIGLVTSSIVIIPARLEKMDTRAIDFTIEKINNQIRKHFNPSLKKVFILGTQYNYQNRSVNDLAYETLQEKYGEMLLKFKIPYSSKISQFNYIGYDKKEVNFEEYRHLLEVVK